MQFRGVKIFHIPIGVFYFIYVLILFIDKIKLFMLYCSVLFIFFVAFDPLEKKQVNMNKFFQLLFVLIAFVINGQNLTFQEIDGQTYELYEKENWNALAQFGKDHKDQNIDYYLFNVRLGIANFELGRYYSASCYFNKALENNTTDLAGEYLYWCYINLGQTDRAKEYYQELSDEVKESVKNCNKVIASVYVEGGYKSSNNSRQDDLTYYSLSMGHRFTDRFSATSNFGMITQDSGWETNNQYNIGFTPSYYLGKGNTLSLGYTYVHNKNYQEGVINNPPALPRLWQADTGITSNVFIVSYSKQFYRFRIEAFGQQISQSTETSTRFVFGVNTTNSTFSNTILGLNGNYTFSLLNDGLTLGGSLATAFGSSYGFFFSPMMSIKVTPKLFTKLTYYSVDQFLYLDRDAYILFANSNTKTSRLAAVLTYFIHPDWQIIGTYSNETVTNTDTTLNHKLNSFFLGVNYNF